MPAGHDEGLRSFDFFDTLVGRHHGSPSDFYRHLAGVFGIPDFPALRRKAEALAPTKDLASIYGRLGASIGADADRCRVMAERELEEDRRWLIPIRANLAALLEDVGASVVVSDTPLSAEQVRSMLARFLPAGVDVARIRIVCTYDGKARGYVWGPRGLGPGAVRKHVGDNLWSDVIRPRLAERAPRTAWFRGSSPTWVERMLGREGYGELARHLRAARLANPYPASDRRARLYTEQIQFNVPMIVWAADHLHRTCRDRGLDQVLFATRDGCLWRGWFGRRYPRYAARELHASRHILQHPSPAYVDYVRGLYDPGRTIVADVQSSGTSLDAFFRAHLPGLPLNWFTLLWTRKRRGPKPSAFLARAGIGTGGFAVEKLNYDLVGTLRGYDAERGALRAPLEYDPRWVAVYHEAFDAAVEALPADLAEQPLPPRRLVARLLTGYLLTNALRRHVWHRRTH